MLIKSGLIFKSPVATVSPKRHLRSFIMSMVGQLMPRGTCAIVLYTHSVLPFFSVLIHFHVIHPNTSVSSVNEHC